jgi:hypothetical protein
MPRPSYWPSMTDYQEALQSPALAFTSSELRLGAPVENKLGLPRPICGTFASVYELVNGQRRWAVKCFLRNTPDLHERYAKISDHLRKYRRLRYFVTFEYQEKAIRVRGELFPIVKMEWVGGYQLNTFIEQNLSRPRVLAKLRRRWDKLVARLRAARIAHGDLQHGNVVVRPNVDIRLIDYDGMWVPALEGEQSNETGHQDYQNPRRTHRDFHSSIDEFSSAVIQIAISALRREPSLWDKYNNGDNLLFRRRDFVDPQSSALIADLRALDDYKIGEKLDFVINACARAKRASGRHAPHRSAKGKTRGVVKASSSTERPRNADAGAPVRASWLNDHVEGYGTALQASPRITVPAGSQKRAKRFFDRFRRQ